MFTKPYIFEIFLNNCTCCRKKGKSKLKDNENAQGVSLDYPYTKNYEKDNMNNILIRNAINMRKLWEEIKEVKTRLQYLEEVYEPCGNPSKSYSYDDFKDADSIKDVNNKDKYKDADLFVSPVITNGSETDLSDVMLKNVKCDQDDISYNKCSLGVINSKPHNEVEHALQYQKMDYNPESCPVDDRVFYSKRTSDLKTWFQQDEYLVIYCSKKAFSNLNNTEYNYEYTKNSPNELVVLYSPKNSLTTFITEEINEGSTLLPQYESIIINSKKENNSKFNSPVIRFKSTECLNNQARTIYEPQNTILQHISRDSSEGSTDEGDICLDDDDLVTEYGSSHHQVRVVPTRKFSEKIDKWHKIKKLRRLNKKNDL